MEAVKIGIAGQPSDKRWPLSRNAVANALYNPRHNATRGKIAEILVAELIGGQIMPEYEEFDVLLDNEVKIQVKASGYIQAWHKAGDPPSKISFGGLKKKKWLASGTHADKATFNADVYVFCIHTNLDFGALDNELDPNFWDFHVVPVSKLKAADLGSAVRNTVEAMAEKTPPTELAAQIRAVYRAERS